jgi:predicted GNAT family N-acyltransferase
LNVHIEQVGWQQAAAPLRAVREAVFVVEQGIPAAMEWDAEDAGALHLLAHGDGVPVGTVRLLRTGQIGRLAVLPRWRRRGIGRQLLDAAIGLARAQRQPRVFLHAQAHAAAFYARAGFRSTGTVFLEAGIPHVAMALDLGTAGAGSGLPGAAGAPAPAASATGTLRIQDEATMRQQVLAVTRLARRQLRIYSQQLDPLVFDTPDMEQALSDLARRHASTRARILIHDSARMVQVGHRLMKLGRRLSSSIQFKRVVGEQRLAEYTYVLADEQAIVLQPKFSEYRGFAQASDAVLVRQKVLEFDANWYRGVEDPDLRQFRL